MLPCNTDLVLLQVLGSSQWQAARKGTWLPHAFLQHRPSDNAGSKLKWQTACSSTEGNNSATCEVPACLMLACSLRFLATHWHSTYVPSSQARHKWGSLPGAHTSNTARTAAHLSQRRSPMQLE